MISFGLRRNTETAVSTALRALWPSIAGHLVLFWTRERIKQERANEIFPHCHEHLPRYFPLLDRSQTWTVDLYLITLISPYRANFIGDYSGNSRISDFFSLQHCLLHNLRTHLLFSSVFLRNTFKQQDRIRTVVSIIFLFSQFFLNLRCMCVQYHLIMLSYEWHLWLSFEILLNVFVFLQKWMCVDFISREWQQRVIDQVHCGGNKHR